MFLCHKTDLDAWDRIHKIGKIIESYIKVTQDPKEHFSGFLQRLTKAVHIGYQSDQEARWVFIEILAFEILI